MPDNENDAPADDEVEDLAPEEGEATEVTGGARVAYPG